MDQATVGKLTEYGVAGVVAAVMLGLVVLIFKQLINHVLKQNEKDREIHQEHQAKTIESLHAIGQALRDVNTNLQHFQIDVRRDVAEMVRDEVTAVGSRSYPTPRKPR